MAKKVTEIVQDAITPYAESLGLEIVEVEYQKKHNGMNLTIFIAKPEGVSIADCEKLHKLIDQPLDELDPTDNASYILNVSSAGLDRPFKTQRDYIRNMGKEIEIRFYAPMDGKKAIQGVLMDYQDQTISIKDADGNICQIPQSAAAKVVLKIIF